MSNESLKPPLEPQLFPAPGTRISPRPDHGEQSDKGPASSPARRR